MTNLEQLVVPFALCQQIPKDAFNGTALVWWFSGKNYWVVKRYDPTFIRWPSWILAPAPTAQEILEEMPDWHLWKDVGHAVRFFTRGANGTAGIVSKPSRFPEMLLSVWLKVRGMEEQEKADAKEENQWRCTDR